MRKLLLLILLMCSLTAISANDSIPQYSYINVNKVEFECKLSNNFKISLPINEASNVKGLETLEKEEIKDEVFNDLKLFLLAILGIATIYAISCIMSVLIACIYVFLK